jgi:hypothetical protein
MKARYFHFLRIGAGCSTDTGMFSRRVFCQSVGGGGLPGMKLASAVGAGVSLRRALINSL